MSRDLAKRDNKEKLRWRNFPMFLFEPVIKIAQYGEGKYEMFNYLKGGEQNQYLDCIKRHLSAYENPYVPDEDPEHGISHLAAVAWNALVAIYMMEHYPELDDRFTPSKPETPGIKGEKITCYFPDPFYPKEENTIEDGKK